MAVGTFTPTRGHMTYKIMSPSDMEPLGAESAANRDANEIGGPKRLSQADQLLPG